MAIAISKTPTLTGKEAEKFQRLANANKHKRASKKEVREAVDAFVSIVKNQRNRFIF
jgi:hypothetical protein